jgi:hypothetical protein
VAALELKRAIASARDGDEYPDVIPSRLHSLSADYPRAFLLALDHDADVIARSPGVRILRRLPDAIVVETDLAHAIALSEAGEYVAVYDSAVEALLAVALMKADRAVSPPEVFDAPPHTQPSSRVSDKPSERRYVLDHVIKVYVGSAPKCFDMKPMQFFFSSSRARCGRPSNHEPGWILHGAYPLSGRVACGSLHQPLPNAMTEIACLTDMQSTC